MDRHFVWVVGAVLLVAGSVSVAAFRHPVPVAAPVVMAAPPEDPEMKALEAKTVALEAATKRVNAKFDAKDKMDQTQLKISERKGSLVAPNSSVVASSQNASNSSGKIFDSVDPNYASPDYRAPAKPEIIEPEEQNMTAGERAKLRYDAESGEYGHN